MDCFVASLLAMTVTHNVRCGGSLSPGDSTLEQIAYVNGSFVPLSEAKVSILDRGFLFADGIYEVAAVLDGKLSSATISSTAWSIWK
jgi:hypothetical protein